MRLFSFTYISSFLPSFLIPKQDPAIYSLLHVLGSLLLPESTEYMCAPSPFPTGPALYSPRSLVLGLSQRDLGLGPNLRSLMPQQSMGSIDSFPVVLRNPSQS